MRSPPLMKGPGSDVVAKKVKVTEIADTPRLLENAETGSKKPKVLARRGGTNLLTLPAPQMARGQTKHHLLLSV